MTTKRVAMFKPVLFLPIAVILVGCKPVEPGTTLFDSVAPETQVLLSLPVERELTDSKGRVIRAEIVGKDAFDIDIIRLSDSKPFKLPISKLSQKDQNFVKRIRLGSYSAPAEELPYIARRRQEIRQLEKEAEALKVQIKGMGPTLTRDRYVNDREKLFAQILKLQGDITRYKIDRGL